MTTDCPFCDWKGGFSQELAYHLGTEHSQKDSPCGLKHARLTGRAVYCWCGHGPFGYMTDDGDALSQFAVHLQRYGGATAHWLACLLLTVQP